MSTWCTGFNSQGKTFFLYSRTGYGKPVRTGGCDTLEQTREYIKSYLRRHKFFPDFAVALATLERGEIVKFGRGGMLNLYRYDR